MSSLRLGVLLLCISFAVGEIKDKGWWKNTVFYQVYPRSFKDSNNDGIGDLKGITSKLQHFKDSGIGAIWLSPIYASPMVDFGYDISDFRAIHEDYGSMVDLEELTTKAKELGIKVIMDLVPNHTSDEHKWFNGSKNNVEEYKDYYIWHDGKGDKKTDPPNNWISVFSGSAWTYSEERNLWYFHQFERRQPDLNYKNPKVQQEMKDIITFWLNKGIDGFRIDAIPHVFENDEFLDEPKSNNPSATENDYKYLDHIYTKDDPRTYTLIQSWRELLDEYADTNNQTEKVIMTEAYTNLENTTKFYDYGSNVPFNFEFIIRVNNSNTPEEFKNVIDDWMEYTPTNQSANWVMGNHDRSRTASRYPGRADQMTMLAMVLPGVAVTYYGEEIAMVDKRDMSYEETKDPQGCLAGENGYQAASRDPERTPFQWDNTTNAGFNEGAKTWLPVHEGYTSLNLKDQKDDPTSHYNLYCSLTHLKSTSKTLRNGNLKVEALNNNSVLAVVRAYQNESVILLINFSNSKDQTINISSLTPGANSATIYVSSVDSGIKWNSTVLPSNVTLAEKASLILTTNTIADDESGGGTGGGISARPVKVILMTILIALLKL